MVDFSGPIKAGLTQTELAKVLGVSRVTLNLWINGKMKPHRLHVKDVEQRMEQLMRAINMNLIPKRTRRAPRHEAIADAMNQASVSPAGILVTETA